MDQLLEEVINAHGGLDRWERVSQLRAEMSMGGPIWAAKGWAGALDHETITVDADRQHSVIEPFLGPDQRAVFDVADERVTIENSAGRPPVTRAHARDHFRSYVRSTPWDEHDVGYFVGYALWTYLTAPFLLTYPGVQAWEIEPWVEAGQTWRRLQVIFPPAVATHSTKQTFYFDHKLLQRRTDYSPSVLGSSLIGHYTSGHRTFDGIVIPTRRRVFRRNQDGSVNLNLNTITIDIHHVSVITKDSHE